VWIRYKIGDAIASAACCYLVQYVKPLIVTGV
jgi:hypothetical protein